MSFWLRHHSHSVTLKINVIAKKHQINLYINLPSSWTNVIIVVLAKERSTFEIRQQRKIKYYIFKNLGILYAIIVTLSKEQSTIDSKGSRNKQKIYQNNFQAHPLMLPYAFIELNCTCYELPFNVTFIYYVLKEYYVSQLEKTK